MQLINRARLATPAAVLIATSILAPTGALAHEHRDSADGKYTLVVGWQTEPPYVGQANAATIRISLADADPAEPLLGAEQTLHLSYRHGDMTMDVPLRAMIDKPGMYAADIVPDQVGDARWTFSGSINGDAVEEVFDTADGKFDAVKPAAMAEASMDGTSAMATVDVGQVSATVDAIDHAGLHDLDMALQAGSIPAGAMERVHQVDVAIGATLWPVALQNSAAQLAAQLDLLHDAIESGDVSAASKQADEAHMLYHSFSAQTHAWLTEQAGTTAAPSVPAVMSGMDMPHDNYDKGAMDGN